MTVATCHVCGTLTNPGVACTGCGTPVPGDAHSAAGKSGQRDYWEQIQERVTRATAPKYRVTGLLGYGGMAGVFAADEPRLGRRVAMKVLSPAVMVDAQLVERFIQEARTIARLSHPNIVAIHEVDERDGLRWFTMTYVPGRTLDEVMNETLVPIPVAVVRAWLYQIGDALAFAHAHGVVHRDVKPGNVMLDLRGNAMVTDFGIAKVIDVEQGLTRTGLLVGTPTYMSPEQCYGDAVTGASDQYALGIVLYQLLTGTAPFAGQTLAVLQAHLTETATPIRELRPDCAADLAASIHRMLEKRPEDRWPSLAAALAAAGATPPGFDDPVRVRIEELAARVTKLNITRRPTRLLEGSREPVRITTEDSAARVLADRRVEWRSSRPAVAVIAADELLALSPGSTELTASCGRASLSFEVTVEADPVGAVKLRPASAVVHAGGRLRLDAEVADLDGSELEGRVMLWNTSDTGVAQVSEVGVVTGVAPGDATITARSGGKYAASTLTVTTAPVAAPALAAEPTREGPETVGVPSPKRSSVRLGERARRAGRQSATALAAAAARARGGVALAFAFAGRHAVAAGRSAATASGAVGRGAATASGAAGRGAATISGAVGRALRGTMSAVTRMSRRANATLGTAAQSMRAVMPALMKRARRRTLAVAGAATVVTLVAVVVVIVSLRMRTSGLGGQTEPTPSAEPTPTMPAGGEESGPTAPLPGARPAAAPPIVNGRILVAGELPAAATVAITDTAGRTWPLSARPLTLPPGRYTLEFEAPGYEAERDSIVLVAGQTERWTPNVRPVRVAQPAPAAPAPEGERESAPDAATAPEPEAAPPARDGAADRAAAVAALEPFVAAFDRRDADVILGALPASEHGRWRPVLESNAITEFSATLPTASVRLQGDLASISFSVTVSYRDEDELQGAHITFFGFVERRDDGWQLYDLEYVSTQDFR